MARCSILIALLALVAACNGVKYERCDLARRLLSAGLPRDQLDMWMCIASRESGYDAGAVNGGHYYGLYQIEDKDWCRSSQSPAGATNYCNVSCDKLLNNVPATVACAKIMYARSSNSWSPWISTYTPCKSLDIKTFTAGCGI